MTSCSTSACGVGGWGGPLPGDPDNNSILTASPAFGGIDVSWSYPTTNPQAVSYVQLYRGLLSNFNAAILIANVGGNFFYDKTTSTQLLQYFYWIKIVSVNGTVGELIGPASAVAKPPIASVIEGLTAQIDSGFLAQSLKTEIDKITLNYAELTGEIANRIAANSALSTALAQVQGGVNQSLAYIGQEITQRQEGDSALVTQVNSVAAANATNLALIQSEQTARVNADSSLATQINTVATSTANNAAAIITEQTARTNADSALSTSITSLTAASNSNAAAIVTEATARADADTALSSQITTAQSTLNDNITSVQTSLQTNINTVNGKVTEIGALYTAKVSVNGLIGGFGIYNDGTTVQAGFDVDEFWVGKTQLNKRKPFIIVDGTTYIDEAAIEKLTFTKLRDASGSFIVEDGKVKADYLSVTQITSGAYTGYAWPDAGAANTGFFLGPGGLLMGNYNNGKYVQITEGGDFYSPGFSVVAGSATFSGSLSANTVTTSSIKSGDVTAGYAVQTTGTSVAVTVSNSSGATAMLIMVQAGDPTTAQGGSGEYLETITYYPTATINVNGTNVATGNVAINYIATSVPTGNFNVTALRPSGTAGILKLFVLVTKR